MNEMIAINSWAAEEIIIYAARNPKLVNRTSAKYIEVQGIANFVGVTMNELLEIIGYDTSTKLALAMISTAANQRVKCIHVDAVKSLLQRLAYKHDITKINQAKKIIDMLCIQSGIEYGRKEL